MPRMLAISAFALSALSSPSVAAPTIGSDFVIGNVVEVRSVKTELYLLIEQNALPQSCAGSTPSPRIRVNEELMQSLAITSLAQGKTRMQVFSDGVEASQHAGIGTHCVATGIFPMDFLN